MNARIWTVVFGTVALAAPAMGQDRAPEAAPARQVEPAAKAFIDEFGAEIEKVRDLTCSVLQRFAAEGEDAKTISGEVTLRIQRNPQGGGSLKAYRIAVGGEDGPVVAFDGKAVTRIDRSRKTFAKLEADKGVAFPIEDAAQVVPSWALGDVLLTPRAEIVQARLLPEAESEGEPCRVVEYTVEIPMLAPGQDGKPVEAATTVLRQVRHVGAKDLLPRRIESRITYRGDVPESAVPRTFLGVYTNVRANTGPSKETFALAAPAGYTVVSADPSDLGIPSDQPPKLKVAAGDAAPDFALKDPNGREVTLAGLKGRVVLLDFWATWCGPCKMAMPSVQALHEKYGGKPVSIFGVNTWERGPANAAQNYMAGQKFTYGLLLKGDDLAKAYGISGIPTFVLIGPDGKILHIGVGFQEGEGEKLSEEIEKALASR